MKNILKFLTSLKLTVVCLSLSMVVVFFGTMAQDPLGLYIAQDRFFHSFFIDSTAFMASIQKTLQMFDIYVERPLTGADVVSGKWIPVFPGGYLLGSVLLVNLIAAHATRFKFTKAKAGIFLTHVGIIVLLVGQLFTDLFSTESNMRIVEGQTSNYSVNPRLSALALIDVSDPDKDRVISIPQTMLKKGGVLEHPDLPFKLRVIDYWKNADVRGQSSPGFTKVDADQGVGPRVHVKEEPVATAQDEFDLAASVIEVFEFDEDHGHDHSLGKWFCWEGLGGHQTFKHGEKEWEIVMRRKRYYNDYTIKLVKARHDKYKGTEIPRNFSSDIVLSASGQPDREVKIYMNNPLRYGGKTFYQYQMSADEARMQQGMQRSSTLQVVQNATWLAPYAACVIVGLGLLIQFLIHFVKFLDRGQKKPAEAKAEPASDRKKSKNPDRKKKAK